MGLLNPFEGDAPRGKAVRSFLVFLFAIAVVVIVILGALLYRNPSSPTPLAAADPWPRALPSFDPGPLGLQYLDYVRNKLPPSAYHHISAWLRQHNGGMLFPLSPTGPRSEGSWPRIVREVSEQGFSLGRATFVHRRYEYVAFRVGEDTGFIGYELR
jgi:hypothetical protein